MNRVSLKGKRKSKKFYSLDPKLRDLSLVRLYSKILVGPDL